MHTKRTGHTDFVDKTSEAAKPISLEAPKASADSGEAMDVDASGNSQPPGTFAIELSFDLFGPVGGQMNILLWKDLLFLCIFLTLNCNMPFHVEMEVVCYHLNFLK